MRARRSWRAVDTGDIAPALSSLAIGRRRTAQRHSVLASLAVPISTRLNGRRSARPARRGQIWRQQVGAQCPAQPAAHDDPFGVEQVHQVPAMPALR